MSMRARVGVLIVCLLAAAAAVARADRREEPRARDAFSTFPMDFSDWHGVQDPPMSQEVLDLLRADDYLTRTYYTPDHAVVGVYVGYWGSQRQGDAIHSPLNCLPGAGWEPLSKGTLSFADPRRADAPPLAVNRLLIQKGLDRELVLYWYQSHGRVVASEYWSKFFLVADAVRLNRTDGAIVRVISPVAGEGPNAESMAEREAMRFVNVLLPRLGGFLPD